MHKHMGGRGIYVFYNEVLCWMYCRSQQGGANGPLRLLMTTVMLVEVQWGTAASARDDTKLPHAMNRQSHENPTV